MQEQILNQFSSPELVLNQMKQLIQSIEGSSIKTSDQGLVSPEISASLKCIEEPEEDLTGKNIVFISYSTMDSDSLLTNSENCPALGE